MVRASAISVIGRLGEKRHHSGFNTSPNGKWRYYRDVYHKYQRRPFRRYGRARVIMKMRDGAYRDK